MASQGLFSIGGIASGLDTTTIIEQLMALERQPVVRLERQQADLAKVKGAWGQVNTKLSSLRAATDKLERLDGFDRFIKVTSSNPGAVGVVASGGTQTGSLSFTVDRLARRMQSSSLDTFASREASIDGRALAITDASGTTHDFTGETLDELVTAINDADIGVRASALQVSTDDGYQLVLDAKDTGTTEAFTVAAIGTTGWTNGFSTTQAPEDAELTVGGIKVFRSSNTITDLVDGATLTLKTTSTEPVTVSAERDVDGAVAAVKGFADALDGVFGLLKELTAYDSETGSAGLLQGDPAARRLAASLRDGISRPAAGLAGAEGLASDLGISFDRGGMLQFDEAKVRQAFTADFDGTAARLARSGSTTDATAVFVGATSAATPGSYDVEVTRPAAVARVVGAGFVPPAEADPKTLRISGPNGKNVDVTITSAQSTVAATVDAINAALAAAGQQELSASEVDGQLVLESTRLGSAAAFTVEELDDAGQVVVGGTVFGLEGIHTGVDVEGTIGGLTASGSGRTLTGTEGAASGVSVRVEGQPADFRVVWTRGIVGELGAVLSLAEGSRGMVARAQQSVDDRVALYQERIDSFEQRLASRETTIRRQFVAMETMLGQLNAQGNWLGQQLAGLSGGQPQ